MSGQYIWKKFNPDFTKIDTRLQAKDLSPRGNNTHFIARSFKKTSQDELKPKKTNKNKPSIREDSQNTKPINNNNINNQQLSSNKDNGNNIGERYNSLNSDVCNHLLEQRKGGVV